MYFKIGDWVVSSDENSLRNVHTQESKSLQPREIALIVYFAQNEQKVISINELIENVWNGRIVGDHAIYQTINKIRKHLDKENKDAFIKTIPKKGYQLTHSVRVLDENKVETHSVSTAQLTTNNIEQSPKNLNIDNSNTVSKNYFKVSLAVLLTCIFLYLAGDLLFSKVSFLKNTPYTLENSLTTLIGYEKDPEFTQEGNFLIFSHKPNVNSHYNLFKKNTTDLSQIQLTDNGFNDIKASASADGKIIVFIQNSEDNCVVKQLSEIKGKYVESELFSCTKNASIDIELSHDGKTLYYTYSDEQNITARVFSLLLRTKKLTQLTHFTVHDAIGDRKLALSPDGKKIAFLRNNGWQKTFLYTYEIATSNLKQHFEFDGWIINLTWKNNSEILYLLPRYISMYSIKHQYHKEMITELSEGINSFDFDDINNRVAFSSGKQSNDIWKMSLNSTEKSQRSIKSSAVDFLPRYANINSKVAFVSNRSGAHQIWLKDEENQLKKITNFVDNRLIMSLNWSPFDKYLLSTTDEYIYMIHVETGEETILVTSKEYRSLDLPTWSNDGKYIYFTSDQNGDYDIYKKNLDTKEITQITQHGAAILFESSNNSEAYAIKNNIKGLWKIEYGNNNHESLLIPEISLEYYNSIVVTKNGVYYTPAEQDTINFYNFTTKENSIIKYLPDLVTSLSVSNDEFSLLYSIAFNEETAISLFN